MKGSSIILDEEQQKAIEDNSKALAIISGPGSGKTRTLVEKARHESRKGNSVIALTFTRNAAQEIRDRAPDVTASTIHSFCYQHLQKFPGDYDELLENYLLLLDKPKFSTVLVDEFQDINALEFKVVLSLVAKGGRLFMVGDPSQSIFGYCEAEGAQISKTGIKKIFLTRNYRSSSNIVSSLEKMNLRQLTSVNKQGNPKVKGTAVLFRENSQLDAVALHLINMGFCFRVRKRGMKFPGEIVGGSNGSHSTENPDIIFSVIHCSKGCEWEKVVCWDWGMRKIEKNLYYVALARASKEFHLINSMSELYQLLKE